MPSDLNKITHPLLYEINTWPWLEAISRNEATAIDLGSVPDRYWDEIADLGFDAVWLMGVWQRSPVAPDHPWATLKPEVFVSGSTADLERDPASFVDIGGRIFANGRDPYFPAWPERCVENHDEPRAASAFGSTRSQVAAVTALTQTGARLVHNGQLEGASK